MIDSIFKQVFDQLSKGKDFTDIDMETQNGKGKNNSRKMPLLIGFINRFKKTSNVKDSNDLKKIGKQIKKGKDIEVDKLISKRYYGKGSSGHYTDKDSVKNHLDEYDGETTVEIPSTAIADVNYNPKTGELWVRYKNSKGKAAGKYYHFINVSPQQFESFMRASSKGRYAQYVLRPKNHDPAYPVTLKKK